MGARPLILVGSGGFAREALGVVQALNSAGRVWDVLGFADDDVSLRGALISGQPVLGACDEVVASHPGAFLVPCPVSPRNHFVKRRLEARLGVEEARYASLVHPAASIAPSVRIGPGAVLLAGVVATGEAAIGRHCAVMPAAVITHDDDVRPFATVAAGVLLAGGVTLGQESYIGAGALIHDGVEVGARSLVGMGSLVRHDVPPGEVWVGSPARWLRDVDQGRGRGHDSADEGGDRTGSGYRQ